MEKSPQSNTSAAPERDHELMRRTASGDLAAFETLAGLYQQRAWAIAWRVLGDAAEAQDAVQDAFLKIFRAASSYRPVAPFRAYLFQVVTRLCLDIRAKKRPDYVAELPDTACETQTPEGTLQRKERALVVRRALDGLSPRHRAAIALRHEEGLSYDEIAQVLGVSAKAVDSLLQRARQSLRQSLEGLL